MTRGLAPILPWLALMSLLAACSGGIDNRLWRSVAGGDLADDIRGAVDALPRAEVVSADAGGVPLFVRGVLGDVHGRVDEEAAAASLGPAVAALAPVFRLSDGDLVLTHVTADALGDVHAHYQQIERGMPVIGGELLLHVDRVGTVYAVNGEARGAIGVSLTPQVAEPEAFASLRDDPMSDGLEIVERGELSLVRRSDMGDVVLAWRFRLVGEPDGEPVDELVFVDASTPGSGAGGAHVVARHPQVHSAKVRQIYDAVNGTSLPGQLVVTEGASVSADPAVGAAYANVGKTYDCLQALFGRDGLDGAGGAMIASVHYGVRHNNAFWQGTQVVFGDGDGVEFGNLTLALDVAAHELGHGVVKHTAGLVYANEPGALNEALCDVIGASCEVWGQGSVGQGAWLIGEEIYTPSVTGDALRYLFHPTLDGSSRDFYGDRYVGQQDFGGVHWNSGIVNLAFYLLANGGTHPRGKTATVVPNIGIWRASRIFYRALASYMTSQTSLQAARFATAEAALDLYDGSIASAVHAAWDAVGVDGGTASGGETTTIDLASGSGIDGLSGASGEELHYRVVVPVGSSELRVVTSGGTGDVDLYVRYGQPATPQAYDHRPYLSGNEEAVVVSPPAAGTWYVMVRGYRAFSDVSLLATYQQAAGGGADVLRNDEAVTGISGARGTSRGFRFDVPSGSASLSFVLSGGTGDADLYVRYGALPTTSAYDYRPYLSGNNERVGIPAATPGTWYVLVRGYAEFAGVSLVAHHGTQSGVDGLLTNGVPVEDANAAQGGELHFALDVPSGAPLLTVEMGGGTGDADLYVRFGAPVSTMSYDYRPYRAGNEESVRVDLPSAGRWYLLVRGYHAFAGLWIKATYP